MSTRTLTDAEDREDEFYNDGQNTITSLSEYKQLSNQTKVFRKRQQTEHKDSSETKDKEKKILRNVIVFTGRALQEITRDLTM